MLFILKAEKESWQNSGGNRRVLVSDFLRFKINADTLGNEERFSQSEEPAMLY
ncbi:MAG: hypothetical protein GXO77_03090 [Calditrichaeota bacterium]|nr:hypothetical protein [Calditrichota bacterium]